MAVPGSNPVTSPDDVPIIAVAIGVIVHVPPGAPLLSKVVPLGHTLKVPVTGPGEELTVTLTEVEQPVPSVYEMVVVPILVAVITPEIE